MEAPCASCAPRWQAQLAVGSNGDPLEREADQVQLNHKLAVKNAGGVFDLDNIEIVDPATHAFIGD